MGIEWPQSVWSLESTNRNSNNNEIQAAIINLMTMMIHNNMNWLKSIGIAISIHKHKLRRDVQFLNDHSPNIIICLNGVSWFGMTLQNCKHGLSNGFHGLKKFMGPRQFMLSMLLRHRRKKKEAEDFLMLLFIASFVTIQLKMILRKKFQTIDIFFLFRLFELLQMNEWWTDFSEIPSTKITKTHRKHRNPNFALNFTQFECVFVSNSENIAEQCK